MDASQIRNLLEHPNLLNESTLVDLKHIVEQFPYFHTAWLLYLRNLKESEDPAFQTEKSRVAAFIPNRGKLQKYMSYQPSIQVKTEFFKTSQAVDPSMFKKAVTATPLVSVQATDSQPQPVVVIPSTVSEPSVDVNKAPASIKDRINDVISKVSTPAIPLDVVSPLAGNVVSTNASVSVQTPVASSPVNVSIDNTDKPVVDHIYENEKLEPIPTYYETHNAYLASNKAEDQLNSPHASMDFDNGHEHHEIEDIHYNARNEYLESNSQEKELKAPHTFKDFANGHEFEQAVDIHFNARNEYLESNSQEKELKAPNTFKDFANGHEFEQAVDIHYNARNEYLESNKLESIDNQAESLEDVAIAETNSNVADIHYNVRNEFLEANSQKQELKAPHTFKDFANGHEYEEAVDIHYNARNEYLDANSQKQALKAPHTFKDFANGHEYEEAVDINCNARNEYLDANSQKQELKAPHTFKDFANGHEYEEAVDIHYNTRNEFLEANKPEETSMEAESLEDLAIEEADSDLTDIHYNARNEFLESNNHKLELKAPHTFKDFDNGHEYHEVVDIHPDARNEYLDANAHAEVETVANIPAKDAGLLVLEDEAKVVPTEQAKPLDAADSLLARIQALKKSKMTNSATQQEPANDSPNISTDSEKNSDLIVLDTEAVEIPAEVQLPVSNSKEVEIESSATLAKENDLNKSEDGPKDLSNDILDKIARIKAKKLQPQADEASITADTETSLAGEQPQKPKRNLIDDFITAGSRITRKVPMDSPLAKEPQEDISVHSIKESDDFITEGLAKVFVGQKYYEKAIDAYQKLILKYPEKSSYFASQIENVQELINKQKK